VASEKEEEALLHNHPMRRGGKISQDRRDRFPRSRLRNPTAAALPAKQLSFSEAELPR
jgi:hypothetical protein